MNKEIKIVIEGLERDEGFITANALINTLREIVAPFNKVDKYFYKKGRPTIHYWITEVNYQSPLTCILEERIDPDVDDYRDVITNEVASIYKSVNEGSFEKREEKYGLVENMVKITKLIDNQIKSAKIYANGNVVEIGAEFKAKVNLALVKEETCDGTIRGMLEYINIHKEKNVFRIYPDIGPSRITCHFPSEKMPEAVKAIGKYVEVRGKIKFKSVSKYAHELFVEEIEKIPDDKDLPSIFELRGIAPGITGDMSTEDFVRKIRDAQVY